MKIAHHVPVSRRAFEALSSAAGASHFRHIKKYHTYKVSGSRVECSYKTLFGTIDQIMHIMPDTIVFSGTGPHGTSFHGSWTFCDNTVYLEQHIECPFYARPFVRARVQETLEDLRSLPV